MADRCVTDYLPIAEHGVIGDQRSVALVGTDGTIDWYCPERFDAPSVFASILDRQRGGSFRIAATRSGVQTKQLYLPDTNVLVTRFLSPDGVGELHDFMTLASDRQELVRRVVSISGVMPFTVHVAPRFDYARDCHTVRLTPDGLVFETKDASLALASSERLRVRGCDATAEFEVAAGESRCFVLRPGTDAGPITDADADELARATAAAWRGWLTESTYSGRWRERVNRSALTLALLTYAPTGAIVAAATTSLPESVGGTRNWDYRYAWARDFAFSQYALSRLGFTEEARRVNLFTRSVPTQQPGRSGAGTLHPLYRVDGNDDVPEEVLSHLEGYRGSRPVRIGNGASMQHQLDIYGELLDSIYLYELLALDGRGQLTPYEGWNEIAGHIDWLCDHWHEPDDGIWEVRNGPRHFTYSRLMCWVALDRAIKIATIRAFARRDPERGFEREDQDAPVGDNDESVGRYPSISPIGLWGGRIDRK